MIEGSRTPMRRIRVKFDPLHNPPVWASYYEPPGRLACYCHAQSLDEMMIKLSEYFAGRGECPPLRVQENLMQYLQPNERNVGLSPAPTL